MKDKTFEKLERTEICLEIQSWSVEGCHMEKLEYSLHPKIAHQ